MTVVKQDFLCIFNMHKRSFSFVLTWEGNVERIAKLQKTQT